MFLDFHKGTFIISTLSSHLDLDKDIRLKHPCKYSEREETVIEMSKTSDSLPRFDSTKPIQAYRGRRQMNRRQMIEMPQQRLTTGRQILRMGLRTIVYCILGPPLMIFIIFMLTKQAVRRMVQACRRLMVRFPPQRPTGWQILRLGLQAFKYCVIGPPVLICLIYILTERASQRIAQIGINRLTIKRAMRRSIYWAIRIARNNINSLTIKRAIRRIARNSINRLTFRYRQPGALCKFAKKVSILSLCAVVIFNYDKVFSVFLH